MTTLLAWLESSGLSVWVAQSPSLWAFPAILTLHTLGFGLLVGASAVVDLRLLGIASQIPLAPLRPLFVLMWSGFGLNAVTGSLLFAASATKLGASTFFAGKMLFVAVGMATMVKIKRAVLDAPADAAPAGLSPKVLAALSLVAWAVVITVGRLLAYVL